MFVAISLFFCLHFLDGARSSGDADNRLFLERIDKLRTLQAPYKKTEDVGNFERELYQRIQDPEKYDFIIVGAGAAGATLASRLSEIAEWKILLLEAGDFEDDVTSVPALSTNLLFSKYNWGHFTTTQKNWCLGSKDKKCLVAMGKAVGGSTAINGMLWARGNPRDYNLWAQQGNMGWSYDDVLPYFKKLEYANIKHFNAEHQGKDGRVRLENTHFDSDATEYVLRAAKELQIPYINYNSDKQLGIGHAQGTLNDGRRWSSSKAYLGNPARFTNLFIRSGSTVLKVLLNETTVTAYGVQYLKNNTLYEAHADKEVILSAGGMSTPKLLGISGIGPKLELEKLGIKPIANLPVGARLRTHLAYPGIKFIFNNNKLPKVDEIHDIDDYLNKGRGSFTAFSSDLVAYFNTEYNKDRDTYPDIELTFAPKRHDDRLAVGVNVVLMHPISTGSVKLQSSDPLVPPLIDPNLLGDEDEDDLKTVLAGVRIAERFVNTTIFKKHGGYLDRTPTKGCESLEFGTDAYWKCSIKYQSICLSDPAGTAKMGSQNDRQAVVDGKLKVHGIKNLRVVDNSVIPVSITGHMMAPAYMIGEKGADIIKYFWRNK